MNKFLNELQELADAKKIQFYTNKLVEELEIKNDN